MISIVSDVALAVGISVAASMVAKTTVTLALVLVGARLARKARAALRHALLAAGFAVLLVLPMASLVGPSVPLEMPIVAGSIGESFEPASPTDSAPTADPVVAGSGQRPAIPSTPVSASLLLWTAWAAGTVLFLLPMCIGLWQVRTLRRLGTPWQHGQFVAQQVAVDAGIRRRVDVFLHDAVSGPIACGFVQPTIVLPVDAQTWQEDDLGRAIAHELEHILRCDWATQCIARAVCAFYWFHPLVWIAWRQLALESERACDDAVLRHAEATAYANQLVALAERLSTASKTPLLAMASRKDLVARVAAILDSRQPRGRAGRPSLAIVCVASVLLVATMAPIWIVTAAQTPAATQTFSGSLIDPLGRVLPDARLTLWSLSTQQPVDTRSDPSGRFEFSGIAAGDYRLQVQEYGSQGGITLAAGQHLNRDIALLMPGGEYTLTIRRSEPPTVLPAPPPPLPPPSKTSEPYQDRAALDRCAQVSWFCRVTPPIQMARAQPVYPTTLRDAGIGGTVVVEGRVGTDGLVRDLHTLADGDSDLTNATIEALRRWRFTPIRLDDVAVDMRIQVTANFIAQ